MSNSRDDMMTVMEPFLYAASVDLVLAGHVHAYEHSIQFREASFDHGQQRIVNGTHAFRSWA
ncbi:purple acid phosphatase, putative [Medicago truncatula]|uniref:Purple acid phosphatase, putative n=1 Tax=Medicago truncatula TaxID=3880 RepID=G7K8H2_MEDTR|nr:purple acid phosphatase, putative [Medicago truncatula]